MNRPELVKAISQKTGMSLADSAKALEAVTGSVEDAIAAGERVQLVGFGTFAPKIKPAHEARNPRDGSTISVPKKTTVSFKAGKAFLEKL